MRVNLPVTQREYPFPTGETLVSTTDLQGRILYCNTAFVLVSGFTRDELLGQPHNLIRHPDMPAEAFRDMWQTIQQGQPWSALVKNRRKDGDHYWVRANVTPLTDAGGALVGFMSVRTRPEAGEVAAAEALYARMRAEAEGGRRTLGLHRGQVLALNGLARWLRVLKPGLRGKLTGAAGLVGAVGFTLGLYEAGGLSHLEFMELLRGVVAIGACAVLGGWYLKGLVADPVRRLVDFANQIAGGNLTQDKPPAGNDEIGHLAMALQQLNVNLMSIVRDARNGVAQLRQGTGGIAEGNRDLSARTESQASSLEQTAASMEQITVTLRQNVDRAAEAAGRADDACSVATRSGEQVQALAEVMGRIDAASRKVNEIIQVVDGIAFQTNILALNAAVEAARAGEHGRGFAVVASEVRSLSQRTTVAAREIRGLIQSTVEQITDGTRQTESAQAAMQQAQQAVVSVDGLIRQISSGMREQLLGVSQISEAVSNMDTLTQQNAGLVAEIAQSAQSLNEQASDVAQSVAVFQLPGQASGPVAADAVALRRQAKAARAG